MYFQYQRRWLRVLYSNCYPNNWWSVPKQTENLQEKNVRGIIVAGTYDEKLYYAQNMIQAVDVFLYEVQFKLKEYKK